MSNFEINRYDYQALTTIGYLDVTIPPYSVLSCYVLEDIVRANGIKVPGFTAIPAGDYFVALYDSPTFGLVPCIYNKEFGVIERQGNTWKWVLIHGGNRHADTEACQLAAMEKGTEKSELTVGGETLGYTDHIVWNSCVDEIVRRMNKNEVYTMTINNL